MHDNQEQLWCRETDHQAKVGRAPYSYIGLKMTNYFDNFDQVAYEEWMEATEARDNPPPPPWWVYLLIVVGLCAGFVAMLAVGEA